MQLALELAEYPTYSLWERQSEVPLVIPPIPLFPSLSACHLRCNNAGTSKVSVLCIREIHLNISSYTFDDYDGAKLPITIAVSLVELFDSSAA